jgi:hypothetical protein
MRGKGKKLPAKGRRMRRELGSLKVKDLGL